ERHEDRRDDRAKAERPDDEALEHTEDASQHVRRRRPLEKREPGDVDERVADPEDAEEQQRRHSGRPGAEEDERDAPEDEPERERRPEAPQAYESQGDGGAEEPTDADGRVEEARSRAAEIEQLEGGDDDEHVECASHERLRGVEADDEP